MPPIRTEDVDPTPTMSRKSTSKPRKKSKSKAKTASVKLEELPADHIKRPSNSFMLFRAAEAKRIRELKGSAAKGAPIPPSSAGASIEDPDNLSTTSGAMSRKWHNLSASEKEEWDLKAEVEKAEHMKKYPNYKFRPRRNKGAGADSESNFDSEAGEAGDDDELKKGGFGDDGEYEDPFEFAKYLARANVAFPPPMTESLFSSPYTTPSPSISESTSVFASSSPSGAYSGLVQSREIFNPIPPATLNAPQLNRSNATTTSHVAQRPRNREHNAPVDGTRFAPYPIPSTSGPGAAPQQVPYGSVESISISPPLNVQARVAEVQYQARLAIQAQVHWNMQRSYPGSAGPMPQQSVLHPQASSLSSVSVPQHHAPPAPAPAFEAQRGGITTGWSELHSSYSLTPDAATVDRSSSANTYAGSWAYQDADPYASMNTHPDLFLNAPATARPITIPNPILDNNNGGFNANEPSTYPGDAGQWDWDDSAFLNAYGCDLGYGYVPAAGNGNEMHMMGREGGFMADGYAYEF